MIVDLRLDHSTGNQEAAISAFKDWANYLVTQRRFEMKVEQGDGFTYNIVMTRNDDEPEWLRCTVVATLYVEEDQCDRRIMGEHCGLSLDCRYTQEESGPEVSFETTFTPASIARSRKALDDLLARVR